MDTFAPARIRLSTLRQATSPPSYDQNRSVSEIHEQWKILHFYP